MGAWRCLREVGAAELVTNMDVGDAALLGRIVDRLETMGKVRSLSPARDSSVAPPRLSLVHLSNGDSRSGQTGLGDDALRGVR